MYDNYSQSFLDLLKSEHAYIGQGNPNAKILIIGKECSESEKEMTDNNFNDWKKNCAEDTTIDTIPNGITLNPLNPFNFLRYQVRGNNSPTWDGYQTMINMFLPGEQKVKKGEAYNFWRYCFITELSAYNLDKSYNKRFDETANSIEQRISEQGILRHDFFQQFPIIIFAIHRYHDYYLSKDGHKITDFMGIRKGTQEDFYYTYDGMLIPDKVYASYEDKSSILRYNSNSLSNPNGMKKGEFINVHHSSNGKHIILHTNHSLRNGSTLHSNAYYTTIYELCRDFIR